MAKKIEEQIEMLTEIADSFEYFLCENGEVFMEIANGNHFENWSLQGEFAPEFFKNKYYEYLDHLPEEKAVDSLLKQIIFKTKKSGKTRRVSFRVEELGESIILDIGNENWGVIEITKTGWKVLDKSPVYFYRTNRINAYSLLPDISTVPDDIYLLRKYLNLESVEDFILVLAYCFGVLTKAHNYPILVLQGTQGSAKSTVSKVLKTLLDPGRPILRGAPSKEEDLFIAANQSHLLCLDNLSGLPNWASDSLCKISTSGSFAKRMLYTNSSEVVIEIAKPIIVNGIDELTARPDLGDRSIVLHLPKIKDTDRKSATDLWKDFERDRPKIFQCLLNAISHGLSIKDQVILEQKPRMADFAKFACACLEYFGISRKVTNQLILNNRNQISKDAVDLSSVGRRVVWLMENKIQWQGSPTMLYSELSKYDWVMSTERDLSFPKSPQSLSRDLNRIEPALKAYDIEIDTRRNAESRLIIISKEQRKSSSFATFATESPLSESDQGSL